MAGFAGSLCHCCGGTWAADGCVRSDFRCWQRNAAGGAGSNLTHDTFNVQYSLAMDHWKCAYREVVLMLSSKHFQESNMQFENLQEMPNDRCIIPAFAFLHGNYSSCAGMGRAYGAHDIATLTCWCKPSRSYIKIWYLKDGHTEGNNPPGYVRGRWNR